MKADGALSKDDPWQNATFEGNRREQLQRWAKIPFAQKIENLEEMQKIAVSFQNAKVTTRPVFSFSSPLLPKN
jgi:hypothetical protein